MGYVYNFLLRVIYGLIQRMKQIIVWMLHLCKQYRRQCAAHVEDKRYF